MTKAPAMWIAGALKWFAFNLTQIECKAKRFGHGVLGQVKIVNELDVS